MRGELFTKLQESQKARGEIFIRLQEMKGKCSELASKLQFFRKECADRDRKCALLQGVIDALRDEINNIEKCVEI